MPEISSNNKRILKNTVFMYLRMLLTMCVSLYTVRVVLASLGATDYGINNVVAGVVTMFGFLSSTMSGASQRFFAFDIGRNDQQSLARYFSITFWCYVFLALIGIILLETVGLWVVKEKLVIPPDRMSAALWVYQCAIISFIAQLLVVPFNALILAREKMNLYAYVGVVEALFLLLVALGVKYMGGDKLMLYASLTALSSLSIVAFYIIYDLKHFPESRVKRIWDKKIFRKVFGYSSWSLYGSVSLVFRNQGINILLNIFFGPIVNAARAIAYQIDGAVLKFVNGFYQAVRPQLTKYYAMGEEKMMLTLTYRTSRLCFYLFYVFAVPLFIETPYILKLWLGQAPELTVLFTRLVLVNSVVESLAMPFKGVITSTGNIKKNQLICGTIRFLNFPIAWVLLKFGCPPETTMYIAIISSILCHFVRLWISGELTSLTFKEYFKESLLPILVVGFLIPILPVIVHKSVISPFPQFIGVLLTSLVASGVSIWLLGLTRLERNQVASFIKNKIKMK